MAVRVGKHSRLRFGELVTAEGIEFWDLVDLPSIPAQSDDLTYPVQSVDRIDSIATKFYGDPSLWWVIAVANSMEILPTHLNVGAVIKIPSPRFILQELFTRVGVF